MYIYTLLYTYIQNMIELYIHVSMYKYETVYIGYTVSSTYMYCTYIYMIIIICTVYMPR